MSDRIRVLCVDDHRVVREGLAAMINRRPDMEVVAEAAGGEEALAMYRKHQPDVTLMDLQLPGVNGLGAIRSIRAHCSLVTGMTESRGTRVSAKSAKNGSALIAASVTRAGTGPTGSTSTT